MSSNFKNEFINHMQDVPNSSRIIKYNEYRTDKTIDYICYVEGPTDPDFYQNIKNTSLSSKKIKFIRSLTTREGASKSDIGKEGVIKNYYNISSTNELRKSIFIIDHDYEGLISEFYPKDDLNSNVFTITEGYAFENYFCTEENLLKIFNYFNLPKSEYDKFINLIYKFVEEISYYTRLKSCTTIACKNCKYHTRLPSTSIFFLYGPKTGQKIESNDIFNFDFNGKHNYYFYKVLMEKQNRKIENAIKNNKLIMEYFYNESIKFENNIRYVRGHDLYNFLEKYLYQKFNININPSIKERRHSKYLDIVRILNIDISLVNGLGEKID